MKYKVVLEPKQQRVVDINKDFTWNGSLFQVDSESQRLIASKALSIVKAQMIGETYGDINWRTSDNLFHTFTPDEFLQFATAVENHIENILYTSWDAIDNGE